MCHYSCIVFGINQLKKEEIENKKILEVGSYDVNGSLRPFVENFKPTEYIGVDVENGPGVDVMLSAEELISKFGKDCFDVVISTELLEHVENWQGVISNIKNVCKPGGLILITTRSYGFPYHPFPNDYWRYELEDMEKIFSDCEILKLEKDNQVPGVLIKLKKPINFSEINLNHYKLYNIVFNERINYMINKITNIKYLNFILKNFLRNKLVNLGKFILNNLN